MFIPNISLSQRQTIRFSSHSHTTVGARSPRYFFLFGGVALAKLFLLNHKRLSEVPLYFCPLIRLSIDKSCTQSSYVPSVLVRLNSDFYVKEDRLHPLRCHRLRKTDRQNRMSPWNAASSSDWTPHVGPPTKRAWVWMNADQANLSNAPLLPCTFLCFPSLSALWRPLAQADNRQLAVLTNYKCFALWYQTVSMSDCPLPHFAAHLPIALLCRVTRCLCPHFPILLYQSYLA